MRKVLRALGYSHLDYVSICFGDGIAAALVTVMVLNCMVSSRLRNLPLVLACLMNMAAFYSIVAAHACYVLAFLLVEIVEQALLSSRE